MPAPDPSNSRRAIFLSALVSGKYEQSSSVFKLRSFDGKFCTEGLLCQLFIEAHNNNEFQWTDNGEFQTPEGVYDRSPNYVEEFFGIPSNVKLLEMEHTGNTFEEIARFLA